MSEQLAITGPRASDQLATFLGIDKGMMLETLKAQCFKGKRPDEVSDTQLAAFVSTANVLQVNPLIPGMLYAYPERNGGITPILGPDGVFKKLDEFIASGKITGFECEVHMGTDGKPDRAEATIFRSGDQKPAKYTAYFSEWYVDANPNWKARPRHMIWVRAIKQAARQVIHGLPMDADEYAIAQMTDVTPEPTESEGKVERAKVPRKRAGAATVEGETVNETPAAQTETKTVTPAETVKVVEQAKPVEQAKAEPKTVTPEPVKTEAPAASQTSAVAAERAFLKPDEVLSTRVVVVECNGMNIKQGEISSASVQAQVKGGFVGTVFHIAGGIREGDKVVPGKPWAKGAELHITLVGRHNNKLNKTQTFVQTVAPVLNESEEPAMEV